MWVPGDVHLEGEARECADQDESGEPKQAGTAQLLPVLAGRVGFVPPEVEACPDCGEQEAGRRR